MNYYYRDTAGCEVGPVSEDEMHAFHAGGLLLDETPVRSADSADWISYVARFGRLPAAKSAAPAGTKFTRKHWFAIGLVAAVVPLFYAIKQEHTLSFALSLDGNGIRLPEAPSVSVDEARFSTGSRISPGRHLLVVQLEGAEQIERHFWVVLGAKNLGTLALKSSKGSLFVTATPLPAIVIVRDGSKVVRQGTVPLTIEELPVRDYTVVVRRGEYEELRPVKIQRHQRTEVNIELKLGGLDLSAQPPDADFTLSGNGRSWQGRFPTRLDDVPVGTYRLVARRKGWERETDVLVSRGNVTVNKFEFPYSAIELTSDPVGLAVALNGVDVGRTPITVREIKPGPYTLTATDGENELSADITVGPREEARHSFAFLYGTVNLTSTPPGATVFRKGKEIGTTPLTLAHLAVGVSSVVELRLDGYAPSVDFALNVVENVTTNLNAKLFSERYLLNMKHAHEAFDAARFAESQKCLTAALESEPDDSAALKLRDEVAKAEEAWRTEQANANAQALASLPWLDFDNIITDCTDTKQVQYPVQMADGYYQNYVDDNGEKKTRFVQTGTHTEIQTRTDSTFNVARFSAKYRGKMYRFNCPGNWRVSKVGKNGSVTLKAGGMGSGEIKLTAPTSNPGALNSLRKGQKVSIKGVLKDYDSGGLFVPRSLYVEDAEIF